MLIENIDRLFNTSGVTALAIETPGVEITTRGGDEWEKPLSDALALRRSSKRGRIRAVIGADGEYTIFVQSHGDQVAAVVVANGEPFAKSVYRTIHRLGRDKNNHVAPPEVTADSFPPTSDDLPIIDETLGDTEEER